MPTAFDDSVLDEIPQHAPAEVMPQPASRLVQTAPKIMDGSVELKVVSKFCYLGSVLSTSSNIDDVNASGRAWTSQCCVWSSEETFVG